MAIHLYSILTNVDLSSYLVIGPSSYLLFINMLVGVPFEGNHHFETSMSVNASLTYSLSQFTLLVKKTWFEFSPRSR